jgi:hypothetical protein
MAGHIHVISDFSFLKPVKPMKARTTVYPSFRQEIVNAQTIRSRLVNRSELMTAEAYLSTFPGRPNVRTAYKWLRRFREKGAAGLMDRHGTPHYSVQRAETPGLENLLK